MKKILPLFIILCILLALSGCRINSPKSDNPESSTDGTISEQADNYTFNYFDSLSSISQLSKSTLKNYYKVNSYVDFLCYDLDGDGKDEILTNDNCIIDVNSEINGEVKSIGSYGFVSGTVEFFYPDSSTYKGVFATVIGGGAYHFYHITIKSGALNVEKIAEQDYSGINNYKITPHISDEKLVNAAISAFENENKLCFTHLNIITERLLSVMHNKERFINEKGEKVYLKDYLNNADTRFIPSEYTLVNLDRDGELELIVCSNSVTAYPYLILHLKNNEIYGYNLDVRGFEDLKKDGSFISSSGATYNDYNLLSFSDTTYFYNKIAKYYYNHNETDNTLEINGRPVTLDEIKKFADNWNLRPAVEWAKCNS